MKSRGLCFDIETSPIISYTWGIWQQDVIEVIEDYQILTIAWQWVGEKKVYCVGQDDFKGYKAGVNNDTELMKFIWELLDEADYVIAHNGDQFDCKKINTRLLIRGLAPPSPYRQIDTKKIAKRVAGFTSNRLKDLAKDLHVAQKGDSGGFETWKGCLVGDKKAWKQMKKYNKQDIPPLMDLYMRFRPWDKRGIPMNMLEGKPTACPLCGVEAKITKNGKYVSKTGSWQVWTCHACHGHPRSRVKDFQQAYEKMEYVS